MSRYGMFVCLDCKIGLWLGKALFDEEDNVVGFHIGKPTELPNWRRNTLNHVIWKMMADHAGHNLHVAIEGESLYDELTADMTSIGGDEIGDISFAEYLGDQDSES